MNLEEYQNLEEIYKKILWPKNPNFIITTNAQYYDEVFKIYTAKKIQIQSSLVFISFILGIISAIAVIITTNRFDVALLVFAFMSIEISSGILLGSKKYSTYSKYLLIQKIPGEKIFFKNRQMLF